MLWFKIGFFLFMLLQFLGIAESFRRILIQNTKVQSLEIHNENLEKAVEYHQLLTTATKGLYESIYEVDLTHNCIVGESSHRFFESLGISKDTSFDDAIRFVAMTQIKEEFRKDYLALYTRKNILELYAKGTDSLNYETMITPDASSYYWIRITSRIFYWENDQSVRMITYRQNIDEEKARELKLVKQAREDSLTGLYNKATTKEEIDSILKTISPTDCYAFFMLDIDDFKTINDNLGHAFGDFVVTEFAKELKAQFYDSDIVGRIGGDEFVAFLKIPSEEWIEKKARELNRILWKEVRTDSNTYTVSASIGIALSSEAGTTFDTLYRKADKALYQTKENGKNGYRLYRKPSKKHS